MNEDTLFYRERFEKVCNAPTKRHAIYPDQYDDSRSQELWTLWKLGIDHERGIQKVLKVYEDKKARQDSELADKTTEHVAGVRHRRGITDKEVFVASAAKSLGYQWPENAPAHRMIYGGFIITRAEFELACKNKKGRHT